MSLSNLKEVSSGYSNTTDVNSGFCFSSSSVPRSGSVFAKSRVSKRRSINRLHVNPDHSKASPGVNPFQFNSHASVPGSSSDAGNAPLASEYVFRATMSDLRTAGVVEEMKNLKIERGNAFVNEKDGASSRCFDDSVASMLPEDMRKLKIEGSSENRPFERGSDAEFTASTLPEGMRKLKVEGSSENRPYEMGSDAKFIASTLPEGMRKLKIEGSSQERPFEMGSSAKLDVHTNEEVKIGPAIGGAVGGFPGKNVESTLPDELKMKLKINEKSRTNEHGGAFVGNSAADVSNHEKNLDNREPAYSENGLGKTDYNQKTAHRTSSVWEGSGNANAGDHISGIPENVLSKEIEEKLNIGRNSRASVAKPVFEEFSFKPRMAAKDAASGESHSHHLKDHLDVSAPATSLGAFSFSNLSSKAGNNVSGRNEKNDSFTFSSKRNDMKVPFVDFKMPVSKVNIVSGFPEKMEFTAKKEPFNSTKLKKKKGKPKQSTHVQSRLVQDFISAGGISLEKPEPSESYSPMDVSPYHEALADNPCSRGASVTSNESYGLDNTYASNASQSSVSNNEVDEELLLATQHMDINDYEQSREDKEDTTKQGLEQSICTEGPTAESGSAAETDSFQSAEEIDITRADFVALEDRNEASCSSKIDRNSDERRQERSLDSQVEEMRGSNFTFAASSVSQGLPSVPRHKPKKKTWIKSGHASFNFRSTAELPYASSSIQHFPSSVMSSPLSSQLERGDQTTSDYQVGKDFGVKVDSIRISTEAITQEECEKWRLRGNQAYAKGDMSKAEDYYTQGIHCVSRDETSRNCLRALMLCYSNRAATRMSLGKMRDAIGDCMMATTIDPNFFRVQVRAANCYLALGEIDDASRYYKKCLQVGSEVCVDRKVVVEASEGIQKAQKVSECTNHAAELLLARASKDVEIALGLIAEALAISLYSEKLLEMKAEALFMLGRYEAVIQLCEQTLHSAEKNSIPLNEKELCADPDGLEFSKTSYFRVWRSRQMFKSYFQLGRLEEGLASLERQEELWSATNRSGHTSLALLIPLVGTVRELVRLKAAGNDLFQAGRHAEAVENYTTALLCNIESRPFAAICFCNRAAAYKALGQITDAIADCSLAIALDGNYLKALSRRASLFEMIRDYGQAAADLQRLVLVLTRLVGEKNNQSGTYHKSLSSVNELKQARLRLTEIEEASRKDIPLDMYLILGVEPSASLPEIKKAYRKAALRHHPDKASQFLAKGDNGDDKTWKRMAEEVQKDTDRLFKMIGEAYAILSDPTKRLHYDLEEEKRNSEKKHNGSSTVRSYRDDQNQPFERSDGRQRWRDISRFYSTSQARGAEPNRWTRYS